jgi:hypothetical protein
VRETSIYITTYLERNIVDQGLEQEPLKQQPEVAALTFGLVWKNDVS